MGGLQSLGINSINDIRVGKNIQLEVEADSEDNARQIAQEAARKLLANEVMEYFEVTI